MNMLSTANDNTQLMQVMQVMDRINGIWGRRTLRSAAEGIEKDWKIKRERMSPAYTTSWEQVPMVG
jgi:DNA polymerase V